MQRPKQQGYGLKAWLPVFVCLFGIHLTDPAFSQVCDPFSPPANLDHTEVAGTGYLLRWDPVPGSQGIVLRAERPTGGTMQKRVLGMELDQIFLPYTSVFAGPYAWRVAAACSSSFPYNPTPFSQTDTLLVGGPNPCPDSVWDAEGRAYPVAWIARQCWMASNLQTMHFQNGDALAGGLAHAEWAADSVSAYAEVGGDSTNRPIRGLLYNAKAATDPRGICPVGWQVPDQADVKRLNGVLGPNAGGALKALGDNSSGSGLWDYPNTGATDATGMHVQPAGYRNLAGHYSNINEAAFFWALSPLVDVPTMRMYLLQASNTQLTQTVFNVAYGFSVRCLKRVP